MKGTSTKWPPAASAASAAALASSDSRAMVKTMPGSTTPEVRGRRGRFSVFSVNSVHRSSECHQRCVVERSTDKSNVYSPLALGPRSGTAGPARPGTYGNTPAIRRKCRSGTIPGWIVLPAGTWEGHVIVCGLQGVGLRTVEQLHQAGVSVVVVDDEPDPRLVRVVEAWDIPFIVGSPRIGSVLEQAGLSTARAVVCAERTEVQTLETALLISELRPEIRVVVQLANAAVGAAVSQVTGPGTVLDVAASGRPLHRRGLPGP